MNYPCPCCSYLTFDEKPCGTFEICPVCYWEDDNTQINNLDYDGGANGISLNEARKNFALYGAVKKEYIDKVRKPLSKEKT